MSENELKTWAIVEVMGHQEYAGFITAESIAGAPMLRIDVPAVSGMMAFTKYVSPGALYGISPCAEETARARAEALQKQPFASWDVGQMLKDRLRSEGKLIEHKPAQEDEGGQMDF